MNEIPLPTSGAEQSENSPKLTFFRNKEGVPVAKFNSKTLQNISASLNNLTILSIIGLEKKLRLEQKLASTELHLPEWVQAIDENFLFYPPILTVIVNHEDSNEFFTHINATNRQNQDGSGHETYLEDLLGTLRQDMVPKIRTGLHNIPERTQPTSILHTDDTMYAVLKIEWEVGEEGVLKNCGSSIVIYHNQGKSAESLPSQLN